MQGSTFLVAEPVAWVERQKLQFCAFWELCWFIDDQTPLADARFDGHANERSIVPAAQQANGADTLGPLTCASACGSFATLG